MQNKKLFIGVTGGIGSGKTEVCSFLEEFGCIVINSDTLAKQLYKSNSLLKKKLVNEFNSGILDKFGRIDLSGLKKIVFKDKNKQKRVNEIVHPFVINEKLRIFKRIKSGIVVTEAALIYESGSDKYLDYVILVYSNKANRIKRILKRGCMSKSEIERIIRLQMPEKEKLKKADMIINNNGSLKQLKNKTYFIYKVLKTLLI